MNSDELSFQLLARIIVLERLVTQIVVANCIENGVRPEDLLLQAEKMKSSMEAITTGDASAFMNAAIDNIFNALASNLRNNL
jgi:hypothetical protein